MEVAIIAALVTALLGALGWMVAQWVLTVRNRLNNHDRLHAEHKERDGLHEVKIATIVAHQENLTRTVDEVHDDVKTLLRYANGNSGRGTGET